MKTAFGNNLRALRNKKNLSQRKLAELVSTTQPTIANYENGGKYPQKESIKEKLLKVLECSEIDLYGYSDGYYNQHVNLLCTADGAKKAMVYEDHFIDENKEIDECVIDLESFKLLEPKNNKRIIDRKIAEKYPKGYFMKINDESMNKIIPNGSYIYITPEKDKSAYHNHVCAVSIDGFNTIFRRVVFAEYEKLVTLFVQSYSDDYETVIIDPSKNDNFKIIGRAIWFSNDGEDL